MSSKVMGRLGVAGDWAGVGCDEQSVAAAQARTKVSNVRGIELLIVGSGRLVRMKRKCTPADGG
jgi:hypothetical protein